MQRLTLFFILLLSSSALADSAHSADPPDLYIAPYLQNVTPDGITVMWETTEAVVGAVEYGRNGQFNHKVEETEPRKIHEVRLTGLQPAVKYDYRVRYAGKVLKPAYFHTAPPPGTPNWRFVVYGDSRSDPSTHARNVQQIMKAKPGIILNTGDLVAAGSRYEQWKPQYFDPMRGVSEYVPIFPCLGNHEQNAIHYYNYHSLPDEKGEVYYSFDYGNAHFISLNSNSRDAPFELGEEQTEWLIEDLKKNQDATWKFVFFHHPLFRSHPTRGITEQRWVWQPIFEQYGIDMVIAGHDHYYMRSNAIGRYTGEPRRGVYHLISGGGGANTYPMVPKTHAAFRNRIHHVTVIDVMGDRLVGRAIDLDGNAFDAFVVDRQAVNSPEEFIAYEIFELERDLGAAIREMPVAIAIEKGASIDSSLEVPNPFQVPIDVTFAWRGTNGWRVEPDEKSFRLEPGAPLRIPIKASTSNSHPYPVPTTVLHFRRTDGEKAFRNDVVEFYPLRVWRDRTVEVSSVATPPEVDGKLDDAAWKTAPVLDGFVDVQGDRSPLRGVEARMVHHGGTLYVAASMEAPPGLTERGYEGRDNRRSVRDDHFRVHLAVGEEVYQFSVSAHGSEIDAKGRDLRWNSSFRAIASPTSNGWQAEMGIPLEETRPEGKPLKINLVRRDTTANTECELTPTFGASSLDHRVPMYESDSTAVERFTALTLK